MVFGAGGPDSAARQREGPLAKKITQNPRRKGANPFWRGLGEYKTLSRKQAPLLIIRPRQAAFLKVRPIQPLSGKQENNRAQDHNDAAGLVLEGENQRIILHPPAVSDQPNIADPVQQQRTQEP